MKAGHAWNQVKLDGEWYNTDLTWIRDSLVDFKENHDLAPQIMGIFAIHFLSNDNAFYSGQTDVNIDDKTYHVTSVGHNIYPKIPYKKEVCNASLDISNIQRYLSEDYSFPKKYYKDWVLEASNHQTAELVTNQPAIPEQNEKYDTKKPLEINVASHQDHSKTTKRRQRNDRYTDDRDR